MVALQAIVTAATVALVLIATRLASEIEFLERPVAVDADK